MHPTAARSNRSSLQPSTATSALTPPLLHQHQPQTHHQQILYGHIANPMVTLQPCGTGVHPSCVYSASQRNAAPSSPGPLNVQGKGARWQSKNKLLRSQQQYSHQQRQQQHVQQPSFSYNPNPLLLFDQNPSPPPPSNASFLVASSTFTHGPFSSDQYSNSTLTLIPQPYFKSPDVQAFCLLQDRQLRTEQQQQQQQQSSQGSYYNASASNSCTLQTLNTNSSFQLPNLAPYATGFGNNQATGQTMRSTRTYPGPGLLLGGFQREKVDVSPLRLGETKTSSSLEQVQPINEAYWPTRETFDLPVAVDASSPEATLEGTVVSELAAKTREEVQEGYSDDSSAGFDFTIEAEKMVSALCNTTSSNDLPKEETQNEKVHSTAPFTGAGDNVSNKGAWYTDFCADYGSGRSVATQTEAPCRFQYPELIRKTAYWGCSEAEVLLSTFKADFRSSWLTCLSSATRTAITKSQTFFPTFPGNRTLANDLISALLRVSNGWLVLDNYLNKQHYPSIEDRLDRELIRTFQAWEESTYELLRQIVRSFLKLEEKDETCNADQRINEPMATFFPGDVSLYTSYDLFEPPSSAFRQQDLGRNQCQETIFGITQLSAGRNVRFCGSEQSGAQKEPKSRRHADAGVHASSRYRTRANSSSSSRLDAPGQSLNAEFFRLRSKVMESNLKDKKQDRFESKVIPSSVERFEPVFGRCSTLLANHEDEKHPTRGNPSTCNFDPTLHTPTEMSNNSEANYGISGACAINDQSERFRNLEQVRSSSLDPVYVGKSSTTQLELASVPRNRMTLLSQIEPSTTDEESKEMTANLSAWFASMRNVDVTRRGSSSKDTFEPRSHQETSRNAMDLARQLRMDPTRQLQALQNMQSIQSAPWNACNILGNRSHAQHEEYDSSEDVRVYMKPGSYNVPKKRHHRRSNQRVDGTSRGSMAAHRDLYSSKDKSRVPAASTPVSRTTVSSFCTSIGSTTTIKLPFPATPIVPPPTFSLENSPKILKRTNQSVSRDVTWKAACASAEILLEALNVKDGDVLLDADKTSHDFGQEEEKRVVADAKEDVKEDKAMAERGEKSQESCGKGLKRENKDGGGMSSYEASEDDSGSTYRASPSASLIEISPSENRKSLKTNVKTDSWLIRTLNNASIVSKQKRRRSNAEKRSSESSNSSLIEEERPICVASVTTASAVVATTTRIEKFEETTCFHESGQVSCSTEEQVKEADNVVGKATYSETVRRSTAKKEFGKKSKLSFASASTFCSTVIPIPGRRCQRKEPERSSHFLQKSRKSSGRKSTKDSENEGQGEEIASAKSRASRNEEGTRGSVGLKGHGRKKESFLENKCSGKSGDRGWSVWYSSRRKQSLSPLALSKLETIHRTVWQMEDAHIFKYPSSGNNDDRCSATETIEDYCKVVKSPLFLETVEYKLKNRVYHKVEHAVRDFRRIVHNSKLYHKDNHDRVKKIEMLSKRLEELFEEHFSSWDFENISGSPPEDSPLPHRFKSISQDSSSGRYGTAKKNSSCTTTTENTISR
ncbi:hypothetical protein KM043_007503 [Ampulex compressa]|nr:hypothetical protein KM043_007503 [Ampulex compressa]